MQFLCIKTTYKQDTILVRYVLIFNDNYKLNVKFWLNKNIANYDFISLI